MDDQVDRRRTLAWLGAGASLTVLQRVDGGQAWAQLRALHGATHSRTALGTAQEQEDTWHPERLSGDHLALLGDACERILPETDSPGARAASVERFIDRMLARWFPEAASQAFESGVENLQQRARDQHGDSFSSLSEDLQDDLLRELETEAIAARDGSSFSTNPSRLHQQHFFDVFKWLTITGYFTSEVGMREELNYRIVPGRYIPCVEI